MRTKLTKRIEQIETLIRVALQNAGEEDYCSPIVSRLVAGRQAAAGGRTLTPQQHGESRERMRNLQRLIRAQKRIHNAATLITFKRTFAK